MGVQAPMAPIDSQKFMGATYSSPQIRGCHGAPMLTHPLNDINSDIDHHPILLQKSIYT